VALRATTLADKDIALHKLQAVAERSTRLSEQLLDLARLNAGAHSPRHSAVQPLADLDALVRHVASEFDVVAEQRQRHIELAAEPCRIACDIDEIGILLRNLVDNALRYTREGGTVRIGWRAAGGTRCDLQTLPPARRQWRARQRHRAVAGGRHCTAAWGGH
jgi:signal transduction histidine kinase